MQLLIKHWRAIASIAAAAIAFPVIGEWFIELAREMGWYKHPTAQVATAMNWLSSVADIPGLRAVAVFLVGLVAGVWLDTFMRRRERKTSSPLVSVWLDPLSAIKEFADPELQLECSNLRSKIPILHTEIDTLKKLYDEKSKKPDGRSSEDYLQQSAEIGSLAHQDVDAQNRLTQLSENIWKKEQQILDDIIGQLKRGRLVGKAFRVEINKTSESQQIIPFDHWVLLKFETCDERRQTVEGGGKKYTGLQIGLNQNPPL
jgi:hypothetical protein